MGGAEFLLRRADDADLGFRTASIGIAFGVGCLILSATIKPARVPPTSLPRNLKLTGAMFVLLPQASGTSRYVSWAHGWQTTLPLGVLRTWSSFNISRPQEGQIMMHWLMRLTVKKKIGCAKVLRRL